MYRRVSAGSQTARGGRSHVHIAKGANCCKFLLASVRHKELSLLDLPPAGLSRGKTCLFDMFGNRGLFVWLVGCLTSQQQASVSQ